MTTWLKDPHVWPEPTGTRELGQRLRALGLPDHIAELAARAVVFPRNAEIRAVQVEGITDHYEISADFRSGLLLPLQGWRSMGEGGWGQAAPVIPLDEAKLHPSLVPITSYHFQTAPEEFAAAERALLEEPAAARLGTDRMLEIRPGLLHLTQPYLAEQHYPRQQPLLLATLGGHLVAAAHRWADLSVRDVMHFCRDADYWDAWIEVARAGETLRLRRDHPLKHMRYDQVPHRAADAMRSHERARAVGLVIPGRLTLKTASLGAGDANRMATLNLAPMRQPRADCGGGSMTKPDPGRDRA